MNLYQSTLTQPPKIICVHTTSENGIQLRFIFRRFSGNVYHCGSLFIDDVLFQTEFKPTTETMSADHFNLSTIISKIFNEKIFADISLKYQTILFEYNRFDLYFKPLNNITAYISTLGKYAAN